MPEKTLAPLLSRATVARPTAGVTVVIPCLNEEGQIARCLNSLVESDYPKELLEVLVVDGMSRDKTRDIVGDYARRFPYIKMLDNPKKTQQIALNIGIAGAKGEIVVRMDAHCCFAPDYISQCVGYLLSASADNAGGRVISLPRRQTLMGRSIVAAMTEPFGVGHSYFRNMRRSQEEGLRWVNSVPYSCYRRDVFERLGLFHERLARSEDMEFHLRMRESGCRTLFIPTALSYYYVRSEFGAFWRHALDNGLWAILPTLYTGRLVVSIKHCVPMIFLGALALAALAGWAQPEWRWAPIMIAGIYGFVSFVYSWMVAFRNRDFRFAMTMPVVFGALHLGYALGSWAGVLILIKGRIREKVC